MFGFHWPELLILLILAMVVFGPKRFPELGNALGRGLKDFRHGVRDIKEEVGIDEIQAQVRDVRDTVANIPHDVKGSVTEPSHAGAGPATNGTTGSR